MTDQTFYVGSLRNRKLTGYVRSKFLVINGKPAVDATPGGSQNGYIYSDAQGSNQTHGAYANPNNYLIVPEKFTEQQARDYAGRILDTQRIPIIGTQLAQGRMGLDFWPGGPQDIQRNPQWGIPNGSVVPAYVGSASHYLGFVSGLTNTPLDLVERAGGLTNGGNDNTGPHGVSQQNHANLVKGYADATGMPNVERLTSDFGYGSQGQTPVDQIGDGRGVTSWISSLYGVDPSNPTQPISQQQTEGPLGLVSNKPMPQWPVPPPIFNRR